MKISNSFLSSTLALAGVMASGAVLAADLCATDQEREQVRAFLADNPGAVPFSAARRLGLAEAKVASALPAERAVSASGSAFAEVWAALSGVSEALFLITKGNSVFEVMSGVSPGAPSTRSQYFNIEYKEPVRGHLRPDEYAAIYAVDLGSGEGKVQGVLFYDGQGEPVFGVFVSGEGLVTAAENKARFASVKALIAAKPSVCEAPEADGA